MLLPFLRLGVDILDIKFCIELNISRSILKPKIKTTGRELVMLNEV